MAAPNNTNTIMVQTNAGESIKSVEVGSGATATVITAKIGEHYRVVTQKNGRQQLLGNVIATKVGDDLHLEYADGSQVIIEDYFAVCEENECSVTLAGEDAAGYQVAGEAEGLPLEGDASIVYAHGNSDTLMVMAEGSTAMTDAFAALTRNHSHLLSGEGEGEGAAEAAGSETVTGAWVDFGFAVAALGAGAAITLESDNDASIQEHLTNADAALAKIEAYNNGDGTSPAALTTQDYADAGITGVDADKLAAVNAQVLAAATGGADTVAEIQAHVTNAAAALAKIEAYNNGDGAAPAALTAQDYANAGITGVDTDKLAAVNAQVLAAATGGADTVAEIQEHVTNAAAALAKIEAYNNGDGISPAALTTQDYADAGITGVDTDKLAAVNAQVLAAATGGADTVAEIQEHVTNAAAALAKIEAYNNGDGTSPAALTTQDYADAGITGVDADKLAAVNAQVLAAALGGADTVAEIQEHVTNADAALAKIEAYNNGDGTSPAALTTQDYADAGITGVDADKLAAVNAQVLAAALGGADTVAEIQEHVTNAAAALAKIEAYNNGDGISPAALTAQDYANAGITGVDTDKLAAVNAQVLAAALGGADTVAEIQEHVTNAAVALAKIEAYNNGDGTSPAALTTQDYADAGITGVDVDKFAAVNAQVLAAALGGADTVAEIQAHVTNAAVALAKIEAYNNGDGISPAALTTQDYADAGITGVDTDKLAAVNAQVLAAALGGADTVAEIQEHVTNAAAALAKIEAYNNGDGTSPAALTTQDYADAGITGVDVDKFAAVNAQVLAAALGGADTVAEIQEHVTNAAAALAKIEAYNNGDGISPAALTAQDYANAGITGVDADRLAAVNAQVLAAATGGADTVAEIQAHVTNAAAALAKIEAYNNGDGISPAALTTQDYANAGITGVDVDKLAAVNAQVLAAALGGADTVAEIQAHVTNAAAALAKIEAYNNGDGTAPAALTAQDYADAGITGVDVDKLAAVNAQVLAAALGGADTVAEIQAHVTNAAAALAKIEAYNNGDGTSPAALTAQDYADAGITGVDTDKLAAVNAQVLAAASGGADTVAEIQAIVDTPEFNNKVAAVYVAENVATASAVYDAQAAAYFGSGTNDSDITYTLSGTDVDAFNIDTATGELRFVAVPDFEAPADADADNSYELSITATHTPSGQSVDQAVTINVLNQNVHGAQLTAYTRTTADTTPVLEGTGPAGATITVGFAGATYEVVANRFGSWRIDTETAIPTSGSLVIDTENGAASTWYTIALSALVEGEILNSVSGITIADVSATDASAFHLQTYADGTASADGTANDIDYEAYNGDEPSTQNAILIGKSELEYISNAALIALGEAGIGALTWEQVASLSPEQLSALHDDNLLDDFGYGTDTDKPSMILNAITGTDIISEQEMAEGFTVKIDGSGFADATVKLLLDNDRGSWDAPADEATELVDYTVIGEGTADASGHLDFIFTKDADDNDNSNITIGTEVLSGGSLTKKFTVWNDLNDDGIIDIDAGETAERVFYTADGTASMEDAIANPGINYSILDPITHQAFVYFYGDIDHGPQNGMGTDDMDGFMSYSGGWVKGISGNFAADLYEFHANSLSSENEERADWQTSYDRANDQNAGGLLATSASARALSFEQLGAFIAANLGGDAAGSNPDVLDYIRDNAGGGNRGNGNNEDDISGLAGWRTSVPRDWQQDLYWSGTASPSGHAAVVFVNGSMFDVPDTDPVYVANVL